jgi:putative MATE family efflux protein
MKAEALLKEFFQYVILNICGMIGLSCYILADTFFISNGLGVNGLTALNLAIPVYSFVHGSGLMLGIGGATRYSIYRGQKEYRNADQSFSDTIYIMLAMSVMFVLTGMFFSGKLAELSGADKDVFHMTKTYLQVILLFAPAFMANDTMLCFVRNDGNPKLSVIGMLAGSFSNIVLDYIFIFPLHMGIFGAVLATGLAPVISFAVLSRHWLAKQNQFHFVRINPSFRLAWKIISLGIPSFITEMASGIAMIVFNAIILRLQGNIGVAAYGVVANLSIVVISIYTGIAQGAQPILSRAYGYGEHENQKQILKYALKTMLVLSCGIYLFFLLSASPIVSVFNGEQNIQLQRIAETGLKLYFTAIPFAGFNIIISVYFTSAEKALPAQIVSLSRGFLILIPVAFFLSFLLKMTGVWLSFPITECFVTLTGIALYIKSERGRKHVQRNAKKKTNVING